MIDRPTNPNPLYGVARPDRGDVVIDVTDAAITRLIELLLRCPWIVAALSDVTTPPGRRRHAALAALREDPDVRAACAVRLTIPDAVELAAAIIAAASPDYSPADARKDQLR
jgi:hypothetical protein